MSNPRAGTVDGVRQLLSPRWLLTHVVVLLTTAGMTWLGFWQWTGGFTGHSALNTGYALQWWVFSIFAIYFWIKLMRDALRGDKPSESSARSPLARFRKPEVATPVGIREYRMPPAPVVAQDSALGRYNAYLASLENEQPDSAPVSAPAVSASTLSASPVSAQSASDDRSTEENS